MSSLHDFKRIAVISFYHRYVLKRNHLHMNNKNTNISMNLYEDSEQLVQLPCGVMLMNVRKGIFNKLKKLTYFK